MVRRAAANAARRRSSSLAGADGRLAARVLGRTDGARLLTDLRHTTELLDEAAAEGRTTAGVLATWLARQRAEDLDTVSADRVRRMDSDAAAVHLMTIHASKGLQFPVVYAPSLSDLYPRRDEHPLYHDGDGTRCVDVSGGGGMRAAADLAAQEDSGEELRKLYVAATRAQSQLVVWWVPSARNTTTSALHRLVFGRRPGDATVAGIRTGPGRRRGPTDHLCLAGGRSVLGRDVLGGSAAVATELATDPGFPRRPPLHPRPWTGTGPGRPTPASPERPRSTRPRTPTASGR